MTRAEKVKEWFETHISPYQEDDINGWNIYTEYSDGDWYELERNETGFILKEWTFTGKEFIERKLDKFNNVIFEHYNWLSDNEIYFTNIIIK